jgi:hypothetical protein
MENYNSKIKKACEDLTCHSCPLKNKKLCPSPLNNFKLKTDVPILEQLIEAKKEIDTILQENKIENNT